MRIAKSTPQLTKTTEERYLWSHFQNNFVPQQMNDKKHNQNENNINNIQSISTTQH